MKSNEAKPLPALDMLNREFRLDVERGLLIRRSTGKPVGYARPSGHLFFFFQKRHHGVHRVIYFMATGHDPGRLFVDHVNHDPADNRPSNLRLASLAENTRNMSKARSDRSTGVRGLRWREKEKIWYATVRVNGKSHHIGCFKDREDAKLAVVEARSRLFGEFAGKP